jgi:hypothetical protein
MKSHSNSCYGFKELTWFQNVVALQCVNFLSSAFLFLFLRHPVNLETRSFAHTVFSLLFYSVFSGTGILLEILLIVWFVKRLFRKWGVAQQDMASAPSLFFASIPLQLALTIQFYLSTRLTNIPGFLPLGINFIACISTFLILMRKRNVLAKITLSNVWQEGLGIILLLIVMSVYLHVTWLGGGLVGISIYTRL